MTVVINNTVLSNFSLVNRLELLQKLFNKVYITYEVREEVLRGIEEGYHFMEHAKLAIGVGSEAWLELIGFDDLEEEQSFRDYSAKMGYGEASCLALARHRNWLVLTDDRIARKQLHSESLRFTGTLGVLKLALDSGVLALKEGDNLLGQMIQSGYYSPYQSLEEIGE